MLVDTYHENPSINVRSFLSWSLWFLGFPEQARKVSEESVKLAHQVEHPFSEGFALNLAAFLRCWMRDSHEALLLAEELAMMNTSVWLANAAMVRGWAQVKQGRQEGIALVQQRLDGMRAYMDCTTAIFLTTLATANLFRGKYEAALHAVEGALVEVEEKQSAHFEAELYRIKGEALLGLGDANQLEAEVCFNRALEISRRQKAKALELRAAMSLAWHFKQLELLSEVYAWFTEGFDTPDLIEACDLLA
jgi:predicted ATPase